MRKGKAALLSIILTFSSFSALTLLGPIPVTSAQEVWEEIQSIQKTISIPPGETYFAYLDRDSGSIVELPLPSLEVGLSQKASEALAQVPDWLYEDLAKKFAELGDTTIDVGDYATPIFADMDADGDLDLTLGSDAGNIYYYENVGTRFRHVLVENTMMYESVNLNIADSLARTSVAIADLDDDDDNDLIIGESGGTLYYLENIGDMTSASWDSYSQIESDGNTIDVGENSHPTLADLDSDNDYDIVIGAEDGYFYYYENTGSPTEPDWTDYVIDPFSDLFLSQGNSKPNFADLDDDGDLDMNSGESQGVLHYFRNIGSGTSPGFVQDDSMYAGLTMPFGTSPALLDIDADYSYELIVGLNTGALRFFENIGSASDPQWMIWSAYQATPNYVYYPPESWLEYRAESHVDRYADLILGAEYKYKDEIGFAIANTPWQNLVTLDENQCQLFVENAELIYEIDTYLDYADVMDYGDFGSGNYYSTVRYKFNNSGVIEEREFPKEIYYWFIVHPKVTDENVHYINPDTGSIEDPPAGRFWREYLFFHNDTEYPPDPPPDPDGIEHHYPKDEGPPLLKEKLEGIQILYDGAPYVASAGYDNDGHNNNRPWGYKDHAIEAVSNWVAKTLPLNERECGDGERPTQPVRIAHHHNGNCGELQDLTVAAARTALIPTAGVNMPGEDHVWTEFFENGWHQWDNWWSDGGSSVDRASSYWEPWLNGERGRGGSGVWKIIGTDDTVEVTSHYVPTGVRCNVTIGVYDRYGYPVDGARVFMVSWWAVDVDYLPVPIPSIWNYTDSNGQTTFQLAGNNFTIRIVSKVGNAEEEKTYIGTDGGNYNLEFYLEGEVPRPELEAQDNPYPDPSNPEYKIGIDYNVIECLQYPPNPETGHYHPEMQVSANILDSFIANSENFVNYLKGDQFQCYGLIENSNAYLTEFIVPENDDWYFVLSNRDSIETTKVVALTFNLYAPSQPPSVDIQSPLDSSIFETGSVVHISGIADDNNRIEYLNLSTDGGLNWVDITSNLDGIDWYYDWDTSGIGSGNRVIVVEASDGTAQIQDSITISLGDLEPPDVFIVSPSYNSKFDVGDVVEITGTASDNSVIMLLEIRCGSEEDWEDITNNLIDGEWYHYWDTSGLKGGIYNLEVRASDGPNSADDSISVVLEDPYAESLEVEITYPFINSHFKIGEELSLVGTVSGGSGPITLRLSLDDGLNWEDITQYLSDGTFSYLIDTLALSPGEYDIRIRAEDDIDIEEDAISIIIDENLPPEVDAGRDRIVYAGNSIEFSASVSDPDDPLSDLTYYWDFDDSDGIQMEHTGSWPDVLSPSKKFYEIGEFTVTLYANDGLNEVTDTLTVTVLEHSLGIEVGNEYSDGNAKIVAGGYSVYKIELDADEKLHVKLDVFHGDGVYVYLLEGDGELQRYQSRIEVIQYEVSGSRVYLTTHEDYVFTAKESGTYYLVLDNGYYSDSDSAEEVSYGISLKKSKESSFLMVLLVLILIAIIAASVLGFVIYMRRKKGKEVVVFEEM